MNMIHYPTREYNNELIKKYEYYYNNKYSIENFSISYNILDSYNIYKNSLLSKKISLKIDTDIQNRYINIFKIRVEETIGTFVKCNLNFREFTSVIENYVKKNFKFDFDDLLISIKDSSIYKNKISMLNEVFKKMHCIITNCSNCQNGVGRFDDEHFEDKKSLLLYMMSSIYMDQYNNYLFVNDEIIIMMHNKLGIFLSYKDGYSIVKYPLFYQKFKNDSYAKLLINYNKNCIRKKSIIYNSDTNIQYNFNVIIDNNLNCVFDYTTNNLDLKKIEFSKEIYFSNGNRSDIFIDENFKVEEHLIKNKSTRIIKSEYTWINNTLGKESLNSNLRFRGTFKSIENTETKNITDITLKLNGKSEYIKKNNIVILDDTKQKSKNNKLIGWKVAKMSRDLKSNPVIIKLEINSDASICRPIDYEYYLNHRKERCSKAIVVDIQKINFSNPDEEISIVDKCDEAFSYVYENKSGYNYKLGSIVEPDSFDENVNTSCSNGIHYFQERQALFHTYLKELQKNHLKQD